MAVFRASKSEDVVDRCNNFWTVLIFLTLSMVTWFALLCDKPRSPDDGSGYKFKTSCWFPSQFEESHVNYGNTVCGKAFSRLVNGGKETVAAHVVTFNPTEQEPVTERPAVFNESLSDMKSTPSSELKSDDLPTEEENADVVPRRHIDHLPYALFFFALAISLPYILRKMFSECIGFANVDMTLECATKAGGLGESERVRRIQELARCTAKAVKSRPRSCVLSFMVTKLLCCCVLLAALITEHTLSFDGNSYTDGDKNTEISLSQPMICVFSIRQMTNVHDYTVQCFFSKQQTKVSAADVTSRDLYLIPLSNAVMIYLFLLFGANVVSVVMWLCRLTMSQPPSTNLAPGTALDLHFLLLLSHDNAGPLVARDLALALNGVGSGEAVDGDGLLVVSD